MTTCDLFHSVIVETFVTAAIIFNDNIFTLISHLKKAFITVKLLNVRR